MIAAVYWNTRTCLFVVVQRYSFWYMTAVLALMLGTTWIPKLHPLFCILVVSALANAPTYTKN